jgi:hypothetical protein
MEILIIILLITIILLILCRDGSSSSKDGYRYGEYRRFTAGPNPFEGVAKLPDGKEFSVGLFKARVYNYRDEIILHETLNNALETINPGEKVAVLSIDNPICFRRPLEDSAQIIKFLVPELNKMLSSRGLKIATNPIDNLPIYTNADAQDYNYPVGYWLYVVT